MTRKNSASLDAGGLNWDSLPMKLFAGGNAKFWNPADIDFSRDREDWESLTDLERDWAARLCAQFIAGEEAVTQDIQPFMSDAPKGLSTRRKILGAGAQFALHCCGYVDGWNAQWGPALSLSNGRTP